MWVRGAARIFTRSRARPPETPVVARRVAPAWRDLLHHAGEPVVYHWHLERGDDLYAEFALLNGALVALQTHLMGPAAAYPPDGFYVMGEVWRHLDLRSPLMYFPPNDSSESAWPPCENLAR
jgi:hypothetical protein